MRKIIIVFVSCLALSACSLFESSVEEAPEITNATPISQTTITTTSQSPGTTDFVPEGQFDIDLVLDPTLVDATDAEAVAQYVGCGYFIREARSDTFTDVADRLVPFISPELQQAIPNLRDGSQNIVSAQAGPVTEIRFEVYEVGCSMQSTSISGNRTLAADNVELRIVEQEDGSHLVTDLTIGGLTLPADLT